jgi:tubulin alpha
MSDDSPLLTLGVGQAGVRQSDALWQLLCAEHDVADSGLDVRLSDERTLDDDRSLWFMQTRADRFVPRSVLLDTDGDALDSIACGARRELYHHGRLVRSSGAATSASTWARAQTVGRACVDMSMNAVRLLLEQSDHTCGGVLLARASGGGAGAGVASMLLQRFADEFSQIAMMDLCLMPTERLAAAITEPYNAVLGAQDSLDYADAWVAFENDALVENCASAMQLAKTSFAEMNQVWAHVVSSIAAPLALRRGAEQRASLAHICRMLAPHPRLNLLVSHFAPLVPRDRIEHERLAPIDLTRHIYDARHGQTMVDATRGATAAAWLVYRGALDGDSRSLAGALEAFPALRGEPVLRFSHVERVSCGVAGGVVAATPRSLCALTNTSGAQQLVRRQLHKFNRLLSKRAFLHWYEAEGVELAQFIEAREHLLQWCECVVQYG